MVLVQRFEHFHVIVQYRLNIVIIIQTRQVSQITRESHGFWQFLKAHGRETQCSRIFVNLTECCDQGILIFLHADSLLVGRQGTQRLIIKAPRL